MTAEIPRFIEILSLAKLAYQLGWDEHDDARKMAREFPGAVPKRKHGPAKILARISRKALRSQNVVQVPLLSSAERRLLVAAYDQGVIERHEESGS